jgi:hypothetical protein
MGSLCKIEEQNDFMYIEIVHKKETPVNQPNAKQSITIDYDRLRPIIRRRKAITTISNGPPPNS